MTRTSRRLRAFVTRMLVLPNGQVLFNDRTRQPALCLHAEGSANHALICRVIERVRRGEDGVFTLTGRQLNGPSDASAYGDDAQSNENFPIIRLQNSSGLVFYRRSTDWSSTDVGAIPHESVKFTLNPAVTPGVYQLFVSAGGVSLFSGRGSHYRGRTESSPEPGSSLIPTNSSPRNHKAAHVSRFRDVGFPSAATSW